MAYLIRLFLSILGATCGQRCLDYKQQKHQFTEPSCQSLPYCYDYSPKRTVVSLFPDILNHNKIDIQCKMRLLMNIIERSVCYDNSRCWPLCRYVSSEMNCFRIHLINMICDSRLLTLCTRTVKVFWFSCFIWAL